jgi:hypothetical protein
MKVPVKSDCCVLFVVVVVAAAAVVLIIVCMFDDRTFTKSALPSYGATEFKCHFLYRHTSFTFLMSKWRVSAIFRNK